MTDNALLHFKLAATAFVALLVVATDNFPARAQGGTTAQCGTITDPAARLSCYDRVNAAAQAPDGSKSPRWPEFNNAPGASQATRPLASAPAQAPLQNRKLSANVTSFSLSRSRRFTVILDNGQIWQQLGADDGIAQFHDHGPNRVVISHGFWKSYDLRLNDMSAVFKVQRIK